MTRALAKSYQFQTFSTPWATYFSPCTGYTTLRKKIKDGVDSLETIIKAF